MTDWQCIISVSTPNNPQTKKQLEVKLPKSLTRTRKSSLPALKFEQQNLSSYAGLVVFQKLFSELDLSNRLMKRLPHGSLNGHVSFSLLLRLLTVNALLGMRKLRDVDLYGEDPIVRRALGVKALPSVPTISRMLEKCDRKTVSSLQAQSANLVLERLAKEELSTITLDFDGSVISTSRRAQELDEGRWRPERLFLVRKVLEAGVMGSQGPLSIRTNRQPQTGQGGSPAGSLRTVEFGYDYKCDVTNKTCSIKKAVRFLEVRAQQENAFSELKSQGELAYVPFRRQAANQSYMLCSIIAHNISRELQMRTWSKIRSTTEKRAPLWVFEKIQTLRNAFIRKPGRMTNPAGKPTLTLNANPTVEQYMRNYLDAALLFMKRLEYFST